MVLLAAVQNERDTISKRPRGEETENKHGLTTSVLLSAEILSRPATSPPGKLYGTSHLAQFQQRFEHYFCKPKVYLRC